MYLDKRLLRLTQGVRARILAAAFVGLCAVVAGLARLTLSGLVIVNASLDVFDHEFRVPSDQAGNARFAAGRCDSNQA